jgi:hypothetical protein
MASAMSGEVVNTSSAFGTKRANEAGLLMSVVRKCPSEGQTGAIDQQRSDHRADMCRPLHFADKAASSA